MKDQANFGQVLPPTAVRISPDSGVNWTEPGAWRVADGIHRIPLPLPMDGLRAVNVYAIEQRSGFALIDSGWRAPAVSCGKRADTSS